MCFHFLKLYQYHTWTSVRLVAPCKESGEDHVVVMELFMPVCSDHAGHMRHKVPKSSPLYRETLTEISPECQLLEAFSLCTS